MACGILVPQVGMEPVFLPWRYGILTSGPPGKSFKKTFFLILFIFYVTRSAFSSSSPSPGDTFGSFPPMRLRSLYPLLVYFPFAPFSSLSLWVSCAFFFISCYFV